MLKLVSPYRKWMTSLVLIVDQSYSRLHKFALWLWVVSIEQEVGTNGCCCYYVLKVLHFSKAPNSHMTCSFTMYFVYMKIHSHGYNMGDSITMHDHFDEYKVCTGLNDSEIHQLKNCDLKCAAENHVMTQHGSRIFPSISSHAHTLPFPISRFCFWIFSLGTLLLVH